MLDGWYCRSMANANIEEESVDDEESQDEEVINYKEQYRQLKRKLKCLIYENESFQEALRSAQRRLIVATQDRSFLLDRLLLYERVDSSSESDETDSSDDPEQSRIEIKRRRTDTSNSYNNSNHQSTSTGKTHSSAKKKRTVVPKVPKQNVPQPVQTLGTATVNTTADGHMTPEEVERHLQSRQTYMELLPERAPPTVPTEMFSNDPSLDSESNDMGELETSPSNLGEDLSVDMMAE